MVTTVTNINFIFDDQYTSPPTRVSVNFIMGDTNIDLTGKVIVTFNEYISVASDTVAMQNLIKTKVAENMSAQ